MMEKTFHLLILYQLATKLEGHANYDIVRQVLKPVGHLEERATVTTK